MRSRVLDFRGPAEGKCNICGDFGKLTEDHTPPKGCFRPTAVQIQHLYQSLGIESGSRIYKSNNGVRFRSLCARCNNALLGGSYDKALIDFTRNVSQVASFPGVLPSVLTVLGQPQMIMRSVFGHLAAAAVNGYGQWRDYEQLRDWFMSGGTPMPSVYKCYYWLHPYRTQVIVRGFGFTPVLGKSAVFVGWVLKFFPLAFLIVTQEQGLTLSLPQLTDFNHLEKDDEVEIPVFLGEKIHPQWPEAYVGEHGMILSGDHAIRVTESRLATRPTSKW